MKRTIGAALLVLGLGLGVVVPLVADAAPADQVRGNACGDITVDAAYTTASGAIPATAATSITTAKASCLDVTYHLQVFTTSGVKIGDASVLGNGTTSFQLNAAATGAPSTACLSITSETAQGKVIDAAPDNADAQCQVGAYFLLDGGTGGTTMR